MCAYQLSEREHDWCAKHSGNLQLIYCETATHGTVRWLSIRTLDVLSCYINIPLYGSRHLTKLPWELVKGRTYIQTFSQFRGPCVYNCLLGELHCGYKLTSHTSCSF